MLLYTTFTIECAHRIDSALGVPEVHGHSYWVQLYVASTAAMPYPLPNLEKLAAEVKTALDHKLLNDIIVDEPTMEAIIEHIRAQWPDAEFRKIIVRRDSLGTGAEWTA